MAFGISGGTFHRLLDAHTGTWVRPDGVHWKTAPLVDYVDGRPFAWVDDEQSDLDQAYVSTHHRARGLLHHVNPRIGLREYDFRVLADFSLL